MGRLSETETCEVGTIEDVGVMLSAFQTWRLHGGLAWPLPKMPQHLLTAEGLVAVPGQSNTEELRNHSMA